MHTGSFTSHENHPGILAEINNILAESQHQNCGGISQNQRKKLVTLSLILTKNYEE